MQEASVTMVLIALIPAAELAHTTAESIRTFHHTQIQAVLHTTEIMDGVRLQFGETLRITDHLETMAGVRLQVGEILLIQSVLATASVVNY